MNVYTVLRSRSNEQLAAIAGNYGLDISDLDRQQIIELLLDTIRLRIQELVESSQQENQ